MFIIISQLHPLKGEKNQPFIEGVTVSRRWGCAPAVGSLLFRSFFPCSREPPVLGVFACRSIGAQLTHCDQV